MAHVLKIKQGSVAPLVAHYERTPELDCGFTRGNIDPERTALNYNLRPADVRQEVSIAIAEHEQEAGKSIRKDANVLFDWIVTLPRDCPADRSREFFEAVATFMEGRYGRGNVLGCYVHMDEATPHAHVPILPMVGGKMQASKMIDRADLRSFHGDLGEYVDATLGLHVSIELDESAHLDRALSHSGLAQDEFKKARDAAKAEIAADITQAQERLERLRRNGKEAELRIGQLEEAIAVERDRVCAESYAKEAFNGGDKVWEIEDESRAFERQAASVGSRGDAVEARIVKLRERACELHKAVDDARRGMIERVPQHLRERVLRAIERMKGSTARLEVLTRQHERVETVSRGCAR